MTNYDYSFGPSQQELNRQKENLKNLLNAFWDARYNTHHRDYRWVSKYDNSFDAFITQIKADLYDLGVNKD